MLKFRRPVYDVKLFMEWFHTARVELVVSMMYSEPRSFEQRKNGPEQSTIMPKSDGVL